MNFYLNAYTKILQRQKNMHAFIKYYNVSVCDTLNEKNTEYKVMKY
jgi:hypothetical protein